MNLQIPESFVALLAAWNEKRLDRIRPLLDSSLASDVTFADPNYLIQGIDAFEAMVTEFRQGYPTGQCRHTSALDYHHNRYRYTWLVCVNGQPAVSGMDVAELNRDGQIARIDGFFGPFPELGNTNR